jgi:phosphoribosylanthranilate isomerase
MTIVKICGVRTLEEGRTALRSGANWLGFVFWGPSKRCVSVENAARIIRTLRSEQDVGDLESVAALPTQRERDEHREWHDWRAVGVFVDPSPEEVAAVAGECRLDYVQLSGDEDASFVREIPLPTLKAIRVEHGREEEAAAIVRENRLGAHLYLLDTHRDGMYGGTGAQFAWEALRAIGPTCIVAGGLRPENVRAALETLAPRGVDVSGGVEFPGGGKDPRLVKAFVEAVRTHDLVSAS